MINPEDIEKKALRSYSAYLSALVTGAPFFPLEIRFGALRPKGDYHAFDQSRSRLLNAAKPAKKRGYTVELALQATRRYGEQFIPSRIYFEDERDYLAGIGKQREADQFKAMLSDLREHLPEALPWLADRPRDMLPYLEVYPDLIRVCRYMQRHPRPGCYLRELPIEVHTKFIEHHTGILRKLLDAILPEDAIDTGQSRFTLRFGLRDADPLIRFRLLSEPARRAVALPYDELALPAPAFEQVSFHGLTVVIVENLMTFLTLPAGCGDAVIFGKGFQVHVLAQNESLHDAALLYWGDLDAQGFMILSQLRSIFSHTQSRLMDRATYESHKSYVVDGQPCPAESLPGLTREEAALFTYLRDHNDRLEQEHIPVRYVEEQWRR